MINNSFTSNSIPFSRVRKSILNDPSISWRAKGILSYLLGKPKHWKIRAADIVARGKEGKCAVRSAMNELRRNGYAKYYTIKSTSGNGFTEGVWDIYGFKAFESVEKIITPKKMTYDLFLTSQFWLDIRKKCFERDGYMCCRCAGESNCKELHAHHTRYPKDWFKTKLEDLKTLCKKCHKKEHEK